MAATKSRQQMSFSTDIDYFHSENLQMATNLLNFATETINYE